MKWPYLRAIHWFWLWNRIAKKKLEYTQICIYPSDYSRFLKKKKKKKKKRIGSPFAFYFNKVLYRFGRWVISTTHKLKITITHLLTKQRIYVMIHRLRTFGFWMKRDQFCLILLLLVNLQILDMCLARFRKKIHFKRVPTFLFDFFLCNDTIKNLFLSSLFI